jgi:two-component sensor histidine kinase
MAPHTSVSFTLLGAGLMALERPRLRAPIEIMALCATLVGYLAILGYLYHAPELYALGPHVAIALHTAGALIALGIGVSLALPDGRLARALTEEGPPGLLTRRLLPAAVLGPLLVGVIRSVGEHLRLYEKDTGTGIATLACTMIGVAMIWWSAGAMRRLDERRAEAMRRLEEAADSSARAAHELEVSAREKEVLLKEVHHRVKNNLQVIASLLYLQGRHARDEELAGLLMESRDRVYSMALIHEKLYRSHSLARIDFGDYVATLTRALSSSLGIEPARVEIETQAAGVLLDVEAAMPCALIVNELVTNALKHAFPGQCRGHIRVSFQKASPERWELEVSDDGVGLPADFDPRRASTLGMQLVRSLTEQLRGTLELVPKDGTHVRIRFESHASR